MNDDVKDEGLTDEEMVEEVRERLKTLENSLPRQIDPIGISRTKLPFKVLNYREAFIWRMSEIARIAFQAFQAEQFAAAIILTRAAVETVAALWNLRDKVSTVLNDGKLGDLDTYVMRLLSGNYMWMNSPTLSESENSLNLSNAASPDSKMNTTG